MIRDDDIIRDLLLRIEAEPKPELMEMPEIEGCSPKVVAYHVGLLKNAGFIDAILVGDMNVELYMALRLTWQGHEFLDTVRDPEIWRQTKSAAKKVGAGSIAVLAQIAVGIVRANITKVLGLAIE